MEKERLLSQWDWGRLCKGSDNCVETSKMLRTLTGKRKLGKTHSYEE